MKNFSKLLALGVALSLTFGMTAFAAESPSASDGTTQAALDAVADNIGGSDVEVSGVDLAVYETGLALLKEADLVKEFSDEAVKVMDDVEEVKIVRLAAAFDVVGTPNTPITLTNVPNVVAGKQYVMLHILNNVTGAWEPVPVTVNGTGSITFTVSSFSDFLLYEAEITAKDTGSDDNDDDDDTPAVTADGAPASPKTGETLPVAGIVMMIALAGAAVCATKVRYNN